MVVRDTKTQVNSLAGTDEHDGQVILILCG